MYTLYSYLVIIMTTLGVSFEGFPHVPLKERENGRVIPAESMAELNDRHRESLRKQVDMAVEAEALGYEYIVHAEHHADALWANSPNPILTQTAIARETSSVRLLQIANILPWHEPVRLAEQIAMLDILSDGRIAVGVGRGSSDPAAGTMGQYWGGNPGNEQRNRASFEEKYEILLDAWRDDFISYEGQFHQVPSGHIEHADGATVHYLSDEVSEHELKDHLSIPAGSPTQKSLTVLPQPEQSPHPQLWKPALSPQSAKWAARRAMNICTHLMDISDTNEMIDAYYEAAEAARWPDHRDEHDGEPLRRGWDNRRSRGVAIILPVFNTDVASDDARRRWLQSREYAASRDDTVEFEKQPSDDHPISEETRSYSVDIDTLEDDSVPIIGDATEIAEQVCQIEAALALEDAFFIVATEAIGLTYEERIEQLQSFATDVRPELD